MINFFLSIVSNLIRQRFFHQFFNPKVLGFEENQENLCQELSWDDDDNNDDNDNNNNNDDDDDDNNDNDDDNSRPDTSLINFKYFIVSASDD